MPLKPAGALVVVLLWARPAAGVPYEVFIDIETEDDLYDLLVTEQISERSFDALLVLFQTRVDLNVADREVIYQLPNLEYADVDRLIAHRDAVGVIDDLGQLVAADVLEESLVRSIAAFVLLRPLGPERAAAGFLRVQARSSGRHDRLPPAGALQARVRAAPHLDSGAVLVLTRNALRRVRWDATRDGFSVEPEAVKVVLPKAYVEWETPSWEVVAGTYRIGFGQRLTFDVTNQASPNGAFGDYELRRTNDLTLRCKRSAGELERSPCPPGPVLRVTPDFAWTRRLAGAAAGWRRAMVGPGWLQLYAWGSFQPHAVASRDIAVASRCGDPRSDREPSCDAPRVYVRDGMRGPRQSAATYASLPLAAAEPLGGLNVGYFMSSRTHIMMTGYGATTRWLIRGVRLDYQEIARKPFGGPFGAIGVSAAHGFGRQDLFVEVARSFDRQAGGGGGLAFVARSVTSVGDGELELSLRAYGPKFANPYARPIAAPDELDGLRARDEAGARARLVQRPHPRISLRSLLDLWRRFDGRSLNALAFGRVDARFTESWRGSVWVEYRSAGKRTLAAARIAFEAVRELTLSLQAQYRWHGQHDQRDVAAVLALSGRPHDRLGVRLRFRYDIEDVFDNHRLPHTAWLLVECTVRVREMDSIRVRYDLRAYLDERESTALREPSPEHWLWLELVFRYGAGASARKERL